MKPAGLGIVGIGGYGNAYMQMIAKVEEEGIGKLVAAVIRNRAKYAEAVAKLEAKGVAIRPSLTEMLAKDGDKLEIVAIPTSIPTHCPMMIETVNAGKDVILEKPPTATIQDMDQMLDALKRTGRWCQVGFQLQAHPVVVRLKQIVCEGKLGDIKGISVACKETRRDNYYARSPWAGKARTDEGWTLDGGVNNPCAHHLMIAMCLAKPVMGRIAEPLSVQAELYRAHEIESEDTAALRVQTKEGPVIHFFSTLAGKANSPRVVTVVGTKGRIVFPGKGDTIVEYADGTKETVPPPQDDLWVSDVFRNAIRFMRGEEKALQCSLEMTRNFVLAVDGAWMSAGVPRKIPQEMLRIYHDEKTKSRAIEIPEIEELIDRGAAEGKLYSEMGAPWAEARKPFSLAGFKRFDLAM
jgi:predicted dehydrogenase